jgi:hypothetical protein
MTKLQQTAQEFIDWLDSGAEDMCLSRLKEALKTEQGRVALHALIY